MKQCKSQALPEARDHGRQAEIHLHRMCKTLRKAGWTETADDLGKLARLLHTYTGPQGMLAELEKERDWPEGVE